LVKWSDEAEGMGHRARRSRSQRQTVMSLV
jgi:hypothetical protein